MSDAGLQQAYDALGDPQETRPDGQQLPALQHHIQVTFVTAGGQAATRGDRAPGELRAHGVTILDSGFAPKVSAAELDGINGVFVLLRILALAGRRAQRAADPEHHHHARHRADRHHRDDEGDRRHARRRDARLPAHRRHLQCAGDPPRHRARTLRREPSCVHARATDPTGTRTVYYHAVGGRAQSGGRPRRSRRWRRSFRLWNGTRITVREALSAYGIDAGQRRGAQSRLGQRLDVDLTDDLAGAAWPLSQTLARRALADDAQPRRRLFSGRADSHRVRQ